MAFSIKAVGSFLTKPTYYEGFMDTGAYKS